MSVTIRCIKKTFYEFIEPKRRCKEDESKEISQANATLLGQRIKQTKGGERSKEVGSWFEQTGCGGRK
jgi:hypothetical protein